jgi:hypothetical protein
MRTPDTRNTLGFSKHAYRMSLTFDELRENSGISARYSDDAWALVEDLFSTPIDYGTFIEELHYEALDERITEYSWRMFGDVDIIDWINADDKWFYNIDEYLDSVGGATGEGILSIISSAYRYAVEGDVHDIIQHFKDNTDELFDSS